MNHDNILFLGTPTDKNFLPMLKGSVGSAKVFLSTEPISTLYEVDSYCKKRGITGVITTSPVLLQKLLPISNSSKAPSIDNFAGSLFEKSGIEYVIVHPLEHTVTVPYGKFLLKRYVSKLVFRDKWPNAPSFSWCILNESNAEAEYEKASHAILCAVDIETYRENLAIRCIGFTTLCMVDGSFVARSTVLPLDSMFAYTWAQRFLSLPSQKILQNGKYDINYLMRYGLILYNYAWDTATLMHSWYAELPKDLASLSAFFVRESMYWKDLAETNDLETYYLYNAKDTHQTALVLLGWINEAPSWAWKNYTLEFPVLFPCIQSELTGIKRDYIRLEEQRTRVLSSIETKYASLRSDLGIPNFNSNSPVQVKNLLKALGCGDLESSDETNLKKAILRHPLNSRLLNPILDIRGDRKLVSTYLRTDEDITKTSKGGAKELNGRILYSINPHGTDTGRCASKEHHFWCGLQIQNIPANTDAVKATLCADPGFYLAESDLEQAESRDTAYITGDPNLISAVSSGKDFHSTNASSFFGVPYEDIYDDTTKKTKNKKLRDLAKRVNHGANYNMGWSVLIDTMGEDKIAEARTLLHLPKRLTLREVAEHLLAVFTRTYPVVRVDYQDWIRLTVAKTHLLTGATGWTRYCFSDPSKSKTALNGYVAHNPQSLNAMVLNQAYIRVFTDVALPNPQDFKLLAQIHDSILFQYRIGREDLAHKVKSLMEIPVLIKDIKGVQRQFTVPAALKYGKKYWSEL